jgi:class 3 adenylate cyclase
MHISDQPSTEEPTGEQPAESSGMPPIEPETIVVVDIIESTTTNNLFGWYAVGRGLMRDLRTLITTIGAQRGLQCRKSTGDGYLLTYRDTGSQAAEIGAVNALEASFDLLDRLKDRNQQLPEERAINVRLAIHFGEVDVVEDDREGPNVSFTFRLEGIGQAEVAEAMNSMPSENFPLRNYVLCSEQVKGIIERRCPNFSTSLVGLFRLKGFPGWHEVYHVFPQSNQAE